MNQAVQHGAHPIFALNQDTSSTAQISRNEALPAFKAQVMDCWGNHTSPTRDLPCNILLTCPALEPDKLVVPVNDSGIAVIEGMWSSAVQHDSCMAQQFVGRAACSWCRCARISQCISVAVHS